VLEIQRHFNALLASHKGLLTVVVKRRILVLVERLGQGGAEKMALMLAEMLQSAGKFDVYICAMYRIDAFLFNAKGISVSSLQIEESRGLRGRCINYFKKINRLRKLKKELSIDLTISSLWPADWVNFLTGKDSKIAIIQINILNNIQNLQMVRFRKLFRYIYNRFDRVVVGSASLIDELTGFFKIQRSQLIAIPNSIDVGMIDQNIQIALPVDVARLFKKYHVLVAANRLHETKNTQSLISILKKLPDRSNVKLLIIGEGDEEKNLKESIREEDLLYSRIDCSEFDETADVYLLRFQKNIHNLIHQSKIFLFPTRAEGAPLALLEALCCGTPVLASDCPNGGVFEVMQGSGAYDRYQERTISEQTKAGFLMPIPDRSKPGSIESWSHQISYLLHMDMNMAQAIGVGGRTIAAAYDRESVRLKWLETIDLVLQNKQR
jgi:glycosyltransferase involved in cell wall biosynthesis